ncbi:MAG: hypothetical protein HZC41_23515 [Chloroflexi bacterium]|nr:hypothetical protein [Chloroflexota bacterium]
MQGKWWKVLPLLLVGLVASACTVVQTTGDQMVIQFYNPFEAVGLAPSALRVLYIIAGALLLLLGWRIADFVVGLAGFVIGAGIGMSLVPPGNEALTLVALVAGGLLGAVLAVALQYVAIFLVGAYLGAVLTAQLWAALAVTPVPTLALLIGAVIGGLVLLALSFQFLVIVSAAIGALLIGMALGLPLLWTVLLFVLGLIVQVALARFSGTPVVYRRVYRRRVVRDPLDV